MEFDDNNRDHFSRIIMVFAVDSSEAGHTSHLKCVHDCNRVVQFFRRDGQLLYELCEINATELANMILDALRA